MARLTSNPAHSAILALDQLGYRGEIPSWVVDTFERGENVFVFIERSRDQLECVGPVLPCTLRSALGKPFEVIFYVPDLPRDLVAALAPQLLAREDPRPWSAVAHIELTRSGDQWTARALGHEIAVRSNELLAALSEVEKRLAEQLLELAHSNAAPSAPEPDTSVMDPLGAETLPSPESRYQRIVVRVSYYSSDLACPGWAMSRDGVWAD